MLKSCFHLLFPSLAKMLVMFWLKVVTPGNGSKRTDPAVGRIDFTTQNSKTLEDRDDNVNPVHSVFMQADDKSKERE